MTWTLKFIRPLKPINSPSPLIQEWDDLLERETAQRIQHGQPILLPPSGRPDVNIIRYLNSGSFSRLALQTQQSYAKDLKIFLSFLESQHKSWVQASEDDLSNYEFWRRRDAQNPKRISGTKFARELAAIDRFYKWQISQNNISKSPLTVKSVRQRNGDLVESLSLAPKNVRRTNVKWLTPKAYRQWRDVGLSGYNKQGLRDENWRGRLEGRNVAFSDLLWSSGLRLTEAATLLVSEVPTKRLGDRFIRGRIGESVAKGGAKRDFWISADSIDRITNYIETARHMAIKRAQHEGRYNELRNILLLENETSNGVLTYSTESGNKETIPLNQLTTEMRQRIFVNTGNEIEPVALWLSKSGMPLPVDTWESIFKVANRRCKANDVEIYCHPHMLRHSFALKMLVTLMHVFERRMNISPDERREFRMIFGDPWKLVQTLLGHSSPEVTRTTYLEPVKSIQIDLFLNDSFNEQHTVNDLLSIIAANSGLVTDI